MSLLRILLVEDEPDIRAVMEMALNLDSTIALSAFDSAETALADIARRGSVFDIALLDYRLPGMTGIELHHELRKLPALSELVTVMITASLTQEYVSLFKNEGVAGLIAKPFDVLTLARDVRALGQSRRPASTLIKWIGAHRFRSA